MPSARLSFRHTTALLALAGLLSVGYLLSPSLEPTTVAAPAQTESGERQQTWEKSLALLREGQFDQAASIIDHLAENSENDPQTRQVRKWLNDYHETIQARRERIQADYEKYAQWVQEDIDRYQKDQNRRWWIEAMKDATKAYHSALDKDAFRQEPWLEKAVEGAIQAAKSYEKDHKWYKMANIYYRLKELFPHNKEYRQAVDRAQAHMRLELAYAPESDWKTEVEDIQPKMAREAFRRIETEYIQEADFRQMAIDGLQQMIRLTEEPELAKVFDSLNKPDLVEEFTSRIQVHLDRAEAAEEMDSQELTEIFNRVMEINQNVQLFPANVLTREFVHGTLESLDPYTDMLWPAEIDEFKKHTQGKFSGVGIRIQKDRNEPIKVVSPLPGTPAYRAGIQPGDMITEIEGDPVLNYSIRKAVNRITGEPGTFVRLTIKRKGMDEEFEVKLKREVVTIYTTKGYARDDHGDWKFMIDPDMKIGYLRLTNFTDNSTDELREHITRLREHQDMRGLILDLRNNPGGTLKGAVEVSNLFLDNDRLIVSTKDRVGEPWQVSSTGRAHFDDFPLIVLVNDISASASEIVTGALQVHNRALIIGERTFGKGSVQQVLGLNFISSVSLKLTTAYYYLPNGRCLHRQEDSTTWGVDPDIEVVLVPKEYRKVNEQQIRNEILKGKDQDKLTEEDLREATEYRSTTQETDDEQIDDESSGDEESDSVAKDEEDDEPELDIDREDENEFPELDPQLETALLIMRIRLETGQPWPTPAAEEIAAKPADVPGS